MKKRVTYRPSKASGVIGGVVGGLFVLIGLFVAIPEFGLFGAIWTLFAVVITVANLYQSFGKGYIGPQIDIEDEEEPVRPAMQAGERISGTERDVKNRLEQLESLKNAGLLTKEEYAEKRQKILKDL